MFYLKCNHCGHHNEAVSEYLVFCKQCNKKMSNNFKDWKIRNPEKTFADFQNTECSTTTSNFSAIPVRKKANSKTILKWVAIGILIVAFLIGVKFAGLMIVKKVLNKVGAKEVSSEILDQSWYTESYGEGELTVSTPYKLNPVQLQINDQLKSVMDYFASYSTDNTKEIIITISCFRYKEQLLGSLNLNGGAEGSVAEMKAQPGVSDFVYNTELFNFGDLPGIKTTGSYKKFFIDYDFISKGINDGVRLYYIFVTYKGKDETGKKAAERILESINIKKVN